MVRGWARATAVRYGRWCSKLDWSPDGIGRQIINGSRNDRRVSFRNMQYDHQEGLFFNRLTADFVPMVLRLSDSWRRRRARPKHESAWYSKFKNWYSKNFKVIFSRGSWVSMRSSGIGVKESHQLKTLFAALWRISSWLVRHINLLLFLLTHSTSALFLVLVVFTRVCDKRSSSTTLFWNFHHGNFVVKPTLRSNRRSKFKSSVRYHRKLANSHFRWRSCFFWKTSWWYKHWKLHIITVRHDRYGTAVPKLALRRL